MTSPAVFLDRDGTLNEELDFLSAQDQLVVLPGVVTALHRLRDAGYRLIVVTNQSGIARGFLDQRTLARIHERLHTMLDRLPSAYLHCPHHPVTGEGPYTRRCDCRKPADGMLRRAGQLFDIDIAGSWVIGDSARDVLAGHELGVRTILVESGKPPAGELATLNREGVVPDAVCADLAAAVDHILGTTDTAPVATARGG